MKVPLSWLKEFVPLKAGADEIARRLTLSGFEVEDILTVNGEKVLEVNVTPNRGDCLSIQGMAREVGAIFRLPVKQLPVRRVKEVSAGRTPTIAVNLKAPQKCLRYSLAVISGVRVGPSPEWIAKKLSLVGIRSVNNVVDVTNYLLMELGQPLHAFDQKKIRGGKIEVRRAREKEKILTLDGEEHELISEDLVIADREGAIALAGIMGGKDSEIDGASTVVALESAFFDPSGVRRTARRLGIQTESSYRFERRVDPEGVVIALERAVSLIQEAAGGERIGPIVDLYPGRLSNRRISFSPSDVESLMGGRWPASQVKQNLRRLSLSVREKKRDRWVVSVPSYRGDIARGADLIEEVARLEGLERVPVTFPPMVSPPAGGEPGRRTEKRVRHLLADLGFQEVVHFSFLSPEDLAAFDSSQADKNVVLENPLGREYSVMRPTLIPSLLKTAAFHHRHKIFDLRLFELRNCFFRAEGTVREKKTLTALLTGRRLLSHWSERLQGTDFFDLKGVLERVFWELGISDASFSGSSAPFLHPGEQAEIRLGGKPAGILGEIHPDLMNRFELKRSTFVFELNGEALLEAASLKKDYEAYSLHPVVERDLAIVVDAGVSAGSLLESIRKEDPAIWNVSIFDLYQGTQIPAGKKSLAFSILIGRKDETLTEGEVNAIHQKVVENVKRNFGAEIR